MARYLAYFLNRFYLAPLFSSFIPPSIRNKSIVSGTTQIGILQAQNPFVRSKIQQNQGICLAWGILYLWYRTRLTSWKNIVVSTPFRLLVFSSLSHYGRLLGKNFLTFVRNFSTSSIAPFFRVPSVAAKYNKTKAYALVLVFCATEGTRTLSLSRDRRVL